MTNNNVVAETQPTVFIIEDDPAVAEVIQYLISSINIHTEVFSNGKEYLNTYDPFRKGCLLVDVRMPVMSGLELQERLNSKGCRLPMIFITGHGDISMAVHAMKLGAFNFILKPFNEQLLLEQVQKAIELNISQDKSMNIALYAKLYQKLTPREKDIMQHVCHGKLNKQIAHELNISISTVELHRANMMEKMQVKSLAELIKIYVALDESRLIIVKPEVES